MAISDSDGVKLFKKDKAYIDLSLAFKPSPLTNDITLLRDERSINNSVKNIIMFLPSEVPFEADIGSTTQRYLFDVVDEATAGLLATEIRRAILFGEPRVTFRQMDNSRSIKNLGSGGYGSQTTALIKEDLGVFVDLQPDQNSLAVTVKYRIVGGERIFRVQEILTPTR